MFKKSHNQGFLILFAALIAAIILIIGAGIFSISLKESILSSSSREAQVALNAADAGIECALYYEFSGIPLSTLVNSQINCGDTDGIDVENENSAIRFTAVFRSPLMEEHPCTIVTATTTTGSDGTALRRTVIARGFNICDEDDGPLFGDPFLVERVLRASFSLGAPATGTGGGGGAPDDGSGGTGDTVDTGTAGDGLVPSPSPIDTGTGDGGSPTG